MPTSSTNATTAGSIQGWEIEEHLGVVTTHVVAGAGLISEFFAGFSDIFGGRSESYRRQLACLYEEAVGQLMRETESRGGNWLVGLRVDLDEVSGKGAQMFMITALATAVRARKVHASGAGRPGVERLLASHDVQTMKHRLELIEYTRSGSLHLDDANWSFLVDHRVEEAAPWVLAWLATAYGDESADRDQARKRPSVYFKSIRREVAVATLYDGLSDDHSRAAAFDLIRSLNLGNLARTNEALGSDDLDVRHIALQTLRASQPFYSGSDVTVIDALCDTIPKAFGTRVTQLKKKGLLWGTTDRWACVCSKTNGLELTHCRTCGRDQMGFLEADIHPDEALSRLKGLRVAIVELLTRQGGADLGDSS